MPPPLAKNLKNLAVVFNQLHQCCGRQGFNQEFFLLQLRVNVTSVCWLQRTNYHLTQTNLIAIVDNISVYEVFIAVMFLVDNTAIIALYVYSPSLVSHQLIILPLRSSATFKTLVRLSYLGAPVYYTIRRHTNAQHD